MRDTLNCPCVAPCGPRQNTEKEIDIDIAAVNAWNAPPVLSVFLSVSSSFLRLRIVLCVSFHLLPPPLPQFPCVSPTDHGLIHTFRP